MSYFSLLAANLLLIHLHVTHNQTTHDTSAHNHPLMTQVAGCVEQSDDGYNIVGKETFRQRALDAFFLHQKLCFHKNEVQAFQ